MAGNWADSFFKSTDRTAGAIGAIFGVEAIRTTGSEACALPLGWARMLWGVDLVAVTTVGTSTGASAGAGAIDL